MVETATGRVVLEREERPDLSKPWDPSYEGVCRISVEGDATAVVHHHDGMEERVALV